MKKFKKILAIFTAAVLMTITLATTSAAFDSIIDSEYTNEKILSKYQIELDNINMELGTDLFFPIGYMTKQEIADTANFYSNMSMEEFHKYIYEAHMNYISNATKDRATVSGEFTESVNSSTTQRYFYDGGDNNLFIVANTYTDSGVVKYSKSSISFGYYIYTYPGYSPINCYTQVSSDRTQVSCTFVCHIMIAQGVAYTYTKNVYATFTAGGGDIIEGVQI